MTKAVLPRRRSDAKLRAMKNRTIAPATSNPGADLAWRILGLLNAFRLMVPMLLLVVFFFDVERRSVGTVEPAMFLAVCIGYFAFALLCLQSLELRWPALEVQALLQLLIDAVAIALLMHASGGIKSGLAILLILPAGAISLVVGRRLAMFGVALIAVALLLETAYSILRGLSAGADFFTTGLVGASLFAITLLTLPIANRLRESEALVKQREVDVANLNELNDYIVQHLRDSVLVVDAADGVRLINDTAARLLHGGAVSTGTPLTSLSPRLATLLGEWRQRQDHHRDLNPEFLSADGGSLVRPHFVRLAGNSQGAVLVFLEDTSAVADRVQQSKLAALGRLSASIAHEIRNPVGAMSHAGQLLRESSGLGADERHLTEIIEKNAQRVSQIIENVLQLSRRQAARQERIALQPWLAAFTTEFCATTQLSTAALQVSAIEPADIAIQFDPSHLQQVLWNLCDNAVKHGSAAAATPIELQAGRLTGTGRPFLQVSDRGEGVDPATADSIFEPFFTRGAGGTGLGLFVARELCQTNGAVLLYEPRVGGGSTFRIIFADPTRWDRT